MDSLLNQSIDSQEISDEDVEIFTPEQLAMGSLENLSKNEDDGAEQEQEQEQPETDNDGEGEQPEGDASEEEIAAERQKLLDAKIEEAREARKVVEDLKSDIADAGERLKTATAVVRDVSREIDAVIAQASGDGTRKRGPRSLKSYPEGTSYQATAVETPLGNAFAIVAVLPDDEEKVVVKRSINGLDSVLNEATLTSLGVEAGDVENHYEDSSYAVEIADDKAGQGLTPFSVGSGHWGWMNEDGEVVISPKYDSIVAGFNDDGIAVGEGRIRKGFSRGPLYAIDLDGKHVETLKSAIPEDEDTPQGHEEEAIAAAAGLGDDGEEEDEG